MQACKIITENLPHSKKKRTMDGQMGGGGILYVGGRAPPKHRRAGESPAVSDLRRGGGLPPRAHLQISDISDQVVPNSSKALETISLASSKELAFLRQPTPHQNMHLSRAQMLLQLLEPRD